MGAGDEKDGNKEPAGSDGLRMADEIPGRSAGTRRDWTGLGSRNRDTSNGWLALTIELKWMGRGRLRSSLSIRGEGNYATLVQSPSRSRA